MSATPEFLLELLHEADELILVTDAEGTITFVGPKVGDRLGTTPDEMRGETLFDRVHPADRDLIESGFAEVLETPGQSRDLRSHRLSNEDGRWVWVEASWTNRTDSAIEGYVYCAREVISPPSIDGNPIPYEEPYRDLFELSLNGIALHEIITDEAGDPVDYRFLEVNQAFEDATGLEAEEIIGERATAVIPGIEETDFIEIYGEVALEGETRHFERYSEPLDRHYDIAAFSPKRGLFVTVFNDISDRVARDRRLQHLAETLRTIREANKQLVRATDRKTLVSDIATVIAGHEEFACTFIGLLEDDHVEYVCEAGTDLTAEQVRDIHSPAYVQRVLAEDILLMDDVTAPPYEHHHGDEPPHEGVAIPIRHDAEDYGILTIHFPPGESPASEDFELLEELGGDIGFALHSLELDAERARLEDDLQESIRQITVLDRILRHNLKNDMNVITGFAETIRDRTEGDLSAYAEQIVETGSDLVNMVEKEREITDYLSKPNRREPVDLGSILEPVVEEMRDRYPAAEIDLDQPDDVTVRAPMAISRAFEELLTNAVVHSDRSSPSIEVTVEGAGEGVTISIADDGPGIPEMEREILSGNEAIEPLFHGSGLGLWLVHLAVREAGGSLSFEENEPRGSVVQVELERA